jgi:sugar lactone lactonase YvrE
MKRLLFAFAALALLGGGSSGGVTAPERLVFVRDGDLWSAAPDGSKPERLTRSTASETGPALSPDGKTLAFTSTRSGENEIYRTSTTTWNPRLLSPDPRRDDTQPAWSPDGRQLAWTSNGDVYAMNAAGNARRPVATTAADERDPTWSPDGRTIAYASNGDLFARQGEAGPRQLTTGPETDGEPDWSRSGEIAFVRDGAIYVLPSGGSTPTPLTSGPDDSSPAWSPGGDRLAFVRRGDLLVIGAAGQGLGRVVTGATDPDWGLAPPPPQAPKLVKRSDELLPDLEQRAPTGLVVTRVGSRFKLGFVSAVDNIGRGPVWVVGSRASTKTPVMHATQLVVLRSGGRRAYPNVGILRYTPSPEHSHWHYLRFETYELRRGGDFALIVRDHKSGFCLADHYGYAAVQLRVKPRPRFLGSCAKGHPEATWVEQGSSVGFTDRYPANYHGQNLDITGLGAGTYWLVHRANPFGSLHEITRANDNASVLMRITWPHGHSSTPTISTLRICEGAERCAAPTVP